MKITRISVESHTIEAPKRGRVPLAGAGKSRPTGALVTHVETDAGVTGIGVATLAGPGLAAAQSLIETELAPLLVGESPWARDYVFGKARHHFRAAGFAGLPALAYSGIDVALWDCCGRAASVSVAELLGHATPGGVGFFVGEIGTGWDAGEVAKRAQVAIKSGAMGARVEVGTPDAQADADRVRDLHDALGESAWLGVAAGGRYDLSTALALAHFLEDQGVGYFEEPLPEVDLTGYRRLADRLEIPVALGSGFASVEEFVPVLRDGLARVVRPNLARLGGLTPAAEVARLAARFHAVAAPVGPTVVAAHLGAGLTAVTMVERDETLNALLGGGVTVAGGALTPAGPGLGWATNAGQFVNATNPAARP